MAAEENRIAHLLAIVEEEATAAGGSERTRYRAAYRAIAAKTQLDEEYVYQLHRGHKKNLGPAAVKALSEAYAKGRPAGWMDLPIQPSLHLVEQAEFRERPPTLEEAMEALGEAILGMDDVGREMAGTLLASLVKHPEKAHSLAETLAAFAQLRKRTAEPDPDPPPKPAKIKTAPKADAKRAPGRAALVLKIGGGEKRQYELQLRREAFQPASTVSTKEAQWYERLRSVPKAASD